MPANCRSVTRPGVFGNPFTTARAFRLWLVQGVITITELRNEWLPWTQGMNDRLNERRERILARLPELRGNDLACFCQIGQDCHREVLIELANQ
jgi:hypothetical protein